MTYLQQRAHTAKKIAEQMSVITLHKTPQKFWSAVTHPLQIQRISLYLLALPSLEISPPSSSLFIHSFIFFHSVSSLVVISFLLFFPLHFLGQELHWIIQSAAWFIRVLVVPRHSSLTHQSGGSLRLKNSMAVWSPMTCHCPPTDVQHQHSVFQTARQ